MTQAPLKLLCDEDGQDWLEVTEGGKNESSNEPRLRFHSREQGFHHTHIYLDEESARKLFNYLGIWLHKV